MQTQIIQDDTDKEIKNDEQRFISFEKVNIVISSVLLNHLCHPFYLCQKISK
jgi:hypothetical protein